MSQPTSTLHFANSAPRSLSNDTDGERVAIIGTGATGVYTLYHLLPIPQIREIVMFESDDIAGPGLPYHPHYNDPHALANIAGLEIPTLNESLNAWTVRQPRERLQEWGIADRAADERAFFPRVVLGAWLADQFAMLSSDTGSDKAVAVHMATTVTDIVALPDACEVQYIGADGMLTREVFDRVIVATGYGSNGGMREVSDRDPKRLTGSAAGLANGVRTALLGSSLSAIDAAVSMAMVRGAFFEEAGTLRYRCDGHWRVTMMSRNGILPEADFWFPFPSLPSTHFTLEAATACVIGQDGDLDRLFAIFAKELATRDPEYAHRIDLASANADTFADRYFGPRASGDPFAHAQANRAEAAASHAARTTIPWRHTILQAHEIFGAMLPRLSDADFQRFQGGLKGVFTDNYAAVPHLSIDRLLAMHEAGVLDMLTLGKDYRIEPLSDGRLLVSASDFQYCFDALVDARGQGVAAIDSLPFPTLRLQLCAAAHAEGKKWDDGIAPQEDFTLPRQDPTWRRVHLCALPYLLAGRPFTQGLVECASMARAVADAVAETQTPETLEAEVQHMFEQINAGSIVVMGGGAVLSL